MTSELKSLCDEITANSSSTFCILPWIHLATRPNGDMRLCCTSNASGAETNEIEIGLVKHFHGGPANFSRESPLEAWNNDYMKSVRLQMLSNQIPKSCTKCFKEESSGVVSKRVWETKYWIEEGIDINELVTSTNQDGSISNKFRYLDLRLGNTCNLKCVMCSPHDSSRWLQDHSKLMSVTSSSVVRSQIEFDDISFNNRWYEQPSFWSDIYDQIPNLKQVYFAGGEPLMIKEHKLFLEEIIRRGYAKDIVVRYSSNGVFLTDEIIDLWSYFKQVKFAISIDAYGDRNHYIRFPTKWAEVERALHMLDNTPDNVVVSIATAIQVLNVMHLPDFVKWKISQNYKKINLSVMPGEFVMGGGLINMHFLYIPTFLSAKILPLEYKQELRKRFEEFKLWLQKNYTTDDVFWNVSSYGWKRWDSGIDFIECEDLSHLLPDFSEYIKNLDRIRGTDFSSTFPELKGLV